MNAAELIEQATADGVTLVLSPAGTIKLNGVQAAVDSWLQAIRDNKQDILVELRRECRRARVLASLNEKRFALIVDDDTTDPVIAMVGIRNVATFELSIPHRSYDGMVLLKLFEKHYGEDYATNQT
jgi:hypothetical protein